MEHSQQLWAAPEATDSSGDYLQDPELWLDRLPQPFRMIDGFLQDLLSRTWEAIEARELERQRERVRVRIPELVADGAVEGARGVRAVRAGRSLVFVGCDDGLRACGIPFEACTAHCSMATVTSLAVEQIDDVHIIAACVESGNILLLACLQLTSGLRLIQLADIPVQEDDRKACSVYLAPSCSHLALVTSIRTAEYQVACYQLPMSAWKQEMAPLCEEDVGDDMAANSTIDVTYSKPSPVFVIHPPKPLTPCSSSSQHAALQNVFGSGEVIATGEHHMLTETYLKNRWKTFESKRSGYTHGAPSSTPNKCIPTCHFLFYKNGTKHDKPCYLALWWQSQTQLLFYSLSSKGLAPALERVLPQASIVCATAVSESGRYLAVGLESGVIVTWDLRTNFCRSIQQVVQQSERLTALMFYGGPSETDTYILAVGTNKGSAFVVKSKDLTTTYLNQRVSRQREVYRSLFKSSGYDCCEIVSFSHCLVLPSVVVSVHADGSVILWSADDLEALCKVVPSSTSPSVPAACVVTTEHLFLSVKHCDTDSARQDVKPASDSQSLNFLHLLSVKYLKKYLTQSNIASRTHSVRDTSGDCLAAVESKLMELNTKIFEENEAFQAGRQLKWTEFARKLQVA